MSLLCSESVERQILFLIDSTKARWFWCTWLHIVRKSSGPLLMYVWSILLSRRAAKSGVKELRRKRPNKLELYKHIPHVCRWTGASRRDHNCFAWSLMVDSKFFENWCTKSFFTPLTDINVASYQTLFCRRRCIKLRVGMRGSGVPSYFWLKPAQAICSK